MAKKLVCAVLFVVVVMIACEVIRQTVGLDAGQFEVVGYGVAVLAGLVV